jgi:lysophospholipase L1-like esterase
VSTALNRVEPVRTRWYGAISIVIGLVIALLVLEAGLVLYQKHVRDREHMSAGLILYDEHLGWKLARSWSGRHERSEYRVSYHTGTQGFRVSDSTNNDSTAARWAVLGDSFTFGLGVNDNETFTAVMNREATDKHFINYAVPGYSTDQQWLLLQQNPEIRRARRLLVVVYLGNDPFDNVLSFPLQARHAKPYVELENGKLRVRNQPVPLISKPQAQLQRDLARLNAPRREPAAWRRLLESSAVGALLLNSLFPDRYIANDVSTHFQYETDVIIALLRKIQAQAAEMQPLIVLMPGRSFVQQPYSFSAAYQEYFRREILNAAPEQSLDVIDMATLLRTDYETTSSQLFYPVDGHLTPIGHEFIARAISERL